LLQNDQVGVRETQRALNLKTASHASYHLQKLWEDDIVEKTPQNQYYLKEQYRVRSIQVNVLTDYFLVAGRFWPRTVFFATYLICSLLIALVLLHFELRDVLIYYLLISSILSLIVAIYEIMRQLRVLPWEFDD
jgi:hypothetical protein